MEDEGLSDCLSRLKESKETGQLNAISDPHLDPWEYLKGHYWDNQQNLNMEDVLKES